MVSANRFPEADLSGLIPNGPALRASTGSLCTALGADRTGIFSCGEDGDNLHADLDYGCEGEHSGSST